MNLPLSPNLLADALGLTALIAAGTYGFHLVNEPSGPLRTLVKSASVLAIAGISLALGGPWLLTLALVLSAVGDAFLAGEPNRWLIPGIASFLLAHLAYVVLFAGWGGGAATVLGDLRRLLPCVVALAAALGVLVWLWPSLGTMRVPVVIYALVISAMILTAFALPWTRVSAMVGAVLFYASDGILAVRLFRAGGQSRLADLAVWWFYWTAQALIARASLIHPRV